MAVRPTRANPDPPQCVLCGGEIDSPRPDLAKFCGQPCATEAGELRRILAGGGHSRYRSVAQRLAADLTPGSALARTVAAADEMRERRANDRARLSERERARREAFRAARTTPRPGRAVELVLEQLAGGWRPTSDLLEAVRVADVAERPVRRALHRVGAVSRRVGGRAGWELPATAGERPHAPDQVSNDEVETARFAGLSSHPISTRRPRDTVARSETKPYGRPTMHPSSTNGRSTPSAGASEP